jgi:predicted Zn-dependent protease with MMP-like domain
MERDRFRRLVLRALNGIPREFAPYLDNVAIVIQREPSAEDLAGGRVAPDEDLFGLYVGIPLTERDGGAPALPDRIVIFQGPLERHFPPRAIPREVRRTVAHEVAHHFGIADARLAELGVD